MSNLIACRVCREEKLPSDFYVRSKRTRRTECKTCLKKKSADRRREKCVEISEQRHAFYVTNRERLLSKQNAYTAQNRERESARVRRWRRDNPHKLRQVNVSYYARHRESVLDQKREYHASHIEERRAISRNRKARLKNAPGTGVSAKEWRGIIEYFGGRCAYCLQPNTPLTMDHLIPICRGGQHDPSNVVPACQRCNFRKHTMTHIEFLPRMQEENPLVFAR